MADLDQDRLFTALTRPQMFAGVTYNVFVVNAAVTTELFLFTRSPWVIAAALGLHAAAYLACLHEPRMLDLWLARITRCPRVRNHALWGCNSYAP